MPWDIVYTQQATTWLASLDPNRFRDVRAAIERLKSDGPALGRPLVDRIASSRHHHMKELRASTLRMLFAFAPDRRAVMLLGGDKRGDWRGWYERNIPRADDLYDAYLRKVDRWSS